MGMQSVCGGAGRWRRAVAWWGVVVLGHLVSCGRAGLLDTNPGLSYNFYGTTCPSAEATVRSITWAQVAGNQALPGQLLRLHFHDCFVKGCDASILLDNAQSEKTAPPNGSLGGYPVIDAIKAQLEKACPGVVSCADIVALAARDAVSYQFKAPLWQVETGRRDGPVSLASNTGALPSPSAGFNGLLQSFAAKGLDVNDLVALSGAHTIGKASCSSVTPRLYQGNATSIDPLLDSTYAKTLMNACPNSPTSTSTVDLDGATPFKFDGSYYTNLQNKRGVLASDAALTQNAAAALRRRTRVPPLSAISSSPGPVPSPAARRHHITLSRGGPCLRSPSASAAASSYYIDRILLPRSFSHPLSTSSRDRDKDKEESLPSPPPASWVERWLPEAARPYAMLARLDKPIGTWLLAWPCMWSITIAAMPGELPDLKMLALFGCGAVLLRGAGCTVNDLLDRDIDNKVERTKSRPFASGALTPTQGVCFLGGQLLLGLGILLQLNNFSRVLGASSLLLVFSYPLMKRFTFWPQAYLGLTFNWGALLGWAAIRGSLDPAVILPLYTAGICWTLVYDTIYAHQDKEDDLKVGVKSTALRFGDSTKQWISAFGAASIGSLVLSGYNAELAWPYYPLLTAAAAHLAWQISTVDLSDRADCNRKFVSNKWFGALVSSGILLGRLAS